MIRLGIRLGILLGIVLGSTTATAQQGAFRFEIASTTDSVVTINLGDVKWLQVGMYAIAVDPVHHDELVARLRIKSVSEKAATAVVTGQATAITVEDVVLVEAPKPKHHWYQEAAVWIALVVGAGIGVAASR